MIAKVKKKFLPTLSCLSEGADCIVCLMWRPLLLYKEDALLSYV